MQFNAYKQSNMIKLQGFHQLNKITTNNVKKCDGNSMNKFFMRVLIIHNIKQYQSYLKMSQYRISDTLFNIVDIINNERRIHIVMANKQSDTGLKLNQRLLVLAQGQYLGYISKYHMSDDVAMTDLQSCKAAIKFKCIRKVSINHKTLKINFKQIQNDEKVQKYWCFYFVHQKLAQYWAFLLQREINKLSFRKNIINLPLQIRQGFKNKLTSKSLFQKAQYEPLSIAKTSEELQLEKKQYNLYRMKKKINKIEEQLKSRRIQLQRKLSKSSFDKTQNNQNQKNQIRLLSPGKISRRIVQDYIDQARQPRIRCKDSIVSTTCSIV